MVTFLSMLLVADGLLAVTEPRYEFQQLGVFPPDGPVNPYGSLLAFPDGSLYGTTQNGVGYGGAFKITTNAQVDLLIGFNLSTGMYPLAGLAQGTNDCLYGTTSEGGPNGGFGTVFCITPSGDFATLHSFHDVDGHRPHADLSLGTDGCFYGTTEYGGAGPDGTSYSNGGTVFRISHDGQFTLLVSFTGTNGLYPYGKIVQASDGKFYGTTSFGGDYDGGTIFSMTPAGELTTVFSFGGTNGQSPVAGLLQTSDDTFYGTTEQGGDHNLGTVYRFSTNGTLVTLASFNGPNGKFPEAGLVQGIDGNLYGTTLVGGDHNLGSVYQVTTNGHLTTIVSFNGTNGQAPYATLTMGADGNLYGNTALGGVTADGWTAGGTFFRLVQAPVITRIAASNEVVQLDWSSFARGVYQVESKSELTDTNWTPYGDRITATGNQTSAIDFIGGSASRVYRVAVLPW